MLKNSYKFLLSKEGLVLNDFVGKQVYSECYVEVDNYNDVLEIQKHREKAARSKKSSLKSNSKQRLSKNTYKRIYNPFFSTTLRSFFMYQKGQRMRKRSKNFFGFNMYAYLNTGVREDNKEQGYEKTATFKEPIIYGVYDSGCKYGGKVELPVNDLVLSSIDWETNTILSLVAVDQTRPNINNLTEGLHRKMIFMSELDLLERYMAGSAVYCNSTVIKPVIGVPLCTTKNWHKLVEIEGKLMYWPKQQAHLYFTLKTVGYSLYIKMYLYANVLQQLEASLTSLDLQMCFAYTQSIYDRVSNHLAHCWRLLVYVQAARDLSDVGLTSKLSWAFSVMRFVKLLKVFYSLDGFYFHNLPVVSKKLLRACKKKHQKLVLLRSHVSMDVRVVLTAGDELRRELCSALAFEEDAYFLYFNNRGIPVYTYIYLLFILLVDDTFYNAGSCMRWRERIDYVLFEIQLEEVLASRQNGFDVALEQLQNDRLEIACREATVPILGNWFQRVRNTWVSFWKKREVSGKGYLRNILLDEFGLELKKELVVRRYIVGYTLDVGRPFVKFMTTNRTFKFANVVAPVVNYMSNRIDYEHILKWFYNYVSMFFCYSNLSPDILNKSLLYSQLILREKERKQVILRKPYSVYVKQLGLVSLGLLKAGVKWDSKTLIAYYREKRFDDRFHAFSRYFLRALSGLSGTRLVSNGMFSLGSDRFMISGTETELKLDPKFILTKLTKRMFFYAYWSYQRKKYIMERLWRTMLGGFRYRSGVSVISKVLGIENLRNCLVLGTKYKVRLGTLKNTKRIREVLLKFVRLSVYNKPLVFSFIKLLSFVRRNRRKARYRFVWPRVSSIRAPRLPYIWRKYELLLMRLLYGAIRFDGLLDMYSVLKLLYSRDTGRKRYQRGVASMGFARFRFSKNLGIDSIFKENVLQLYKANAFAYGLEHFYGELKTASLKALPVGSKRLRRRVVEYPVAVRRRVISRLVKLMSKCVGYRKAKLNKKIK